ncbi:hypothetical protein DIPPA_32359 [Diplonema papillatum]|nr:hypothetical protein DIPPA_32359 [Diplonema papillatum]
MSSFLLSRVLAVCCAVAIVFMESCVGTEVDEQIGAERASFRLAVAPSCNGSAERNEVMWTYRPNECLDFTVMRSLGFSGNWMLKGVIGSWSEEQVSVKLGKSCDSAQEHVLKVGSCVEFTSSGETAALTVLEATAGGIDRPNTPNGQVPPADVAGTLLAVNNFTFACGSSPAVPRVSFTIRTGECAAVSRVQPLFAAGQPIVDAVPLYARFACSSGRLLATLSSANECLSRVTGSGPVVVPGHLMLSDTCQHSWVEMRTREEDGLALLFPVSMSAGTCDTVELTREPEVTNSAPSMDVFLEETGEDPPQNATTTDESDGLKATTAIAVTVFGLFVCGLLGVAFFRARSKKQHDYVSRGGYDRQILHAEMDDPDIGLVGLNDSPSMVYSHLPARIEVAS